jgi:hypothetical protein
VLAGAVFDRVGSYAPIIWGCLALSFVAGGASVRIVRSESRAY